MASVTSEHSSLIAQLDKIRIRGNNDKVYKDECVLSFDTPDSESGLYVCLNKFYGFGRNYVETYYRNTGNSVFLHIQRERYEIDKPGDGPERKVTRLAIGVEGGFDPESKIETIENFSIVLLPDFVNFKWPSDELPEIIINSVKSILEAVPALESGKTEVLASWDGEHRTVSKHAYNLKQLNNESKIPISGWKCEKCDLTTNLWLNLTDGKIFCGRKFFDGTGGNEHALEHYKKTGYPLAVKLGTIKDGKADVYSYIEDDMVIDPNLAEHLWHFGINITELEKTDKSIVEMELDLNKKYGEWSQIQESESQLKPLAGPGYTGLLNMGNSCYMNSVLQVLFVVPDFITKYYTQADEFFNKVTISTDPANDLHIQLAKVGVGLLSGRYSRLPTESPNFKRRIIPTIAPAMFNLLISKGHKEFSTNKQQDAQEFVLYLLTIIQRNCRGSFDPTDSFKVTIEERYQCNSTNKVKYTHRTEFCIPLQIPLEAAINREEYDCYLAKKSSNVHTNPNEIVRPIIQFSSCLEKFIQQEIIEQYYSSAIQGTTTAKKTTRLSTFPDFLMIQLKKFQCEGVRAVKLDVAVDMPDEIDLSLLKGDGLQPGEELMPEIIDKPSLPALNQEIIDQLVEMGFPLEASKRATYFTNSQSLQEAVNWIMSHISDDNFSDPFVVPGTESITENTQPDVEVLKSIEAMGFTRRQALKALKATNNNIERAVDWIFSHSEEFDLEEANEHTIANNDNIVPQVLENKTNHPPKYKLIGFISHMGASSEVGHYVCHIFKDNHWVIYNDEKVALSENPPKQLGYLYFYQKIK